MSKYEHINRRSWEQLSTLVMRAADTYFGRIDPNIANGQVLMQAIDHPGISSFIVQRLAAIEREGGTYRELSRWFDQQVDSGTLMAPQDPIEKRRWLALLCLTASEKEEFAYGNVVIPPDYLPEDSDVFQAYVYVYGQSLLDEILRERRSLRK